MSPSEYWSSEAFVQELRTFATAAVGVPTSVTEVRQRFWSTVWRVETPDGVWFAKDNCPGQRHEAATLTRLAALARDLVVPVTAADPARGLLLTPDGGRTLREVGPSTRDWSRVVEAAVELQRRVVPHVEDLALTELRPEDAVDRVRRHLDDLRSLPGRDPRRMPDDAAAVVERLLPDVERWGEQVAALGLPLTFNHNDLHDANVLVGYDPGRLEPRFFDVGDAVATEPLAALRIPVSELQEHLGCAADDPRLWRLVEPPLEVWSNLAPLDALRAALPAALQLDRLSRVESWRRCLSSATPDELAEYGQAPVRWLCSLADPPPLTRASA